jgi:hypothetical protein
MIFLNTSAFSVEHPVTEQVNTTSQLYGCLAVNSAMTVTFGEQKREHRTVKGDWDFKGGDKPDARGASRSSACV